jgi:hypothetical protein
MVFFPLTFPAAEGASFVFEQPLTARTIQNNAVTTTSIFSRRLHGLALIANIITPPDL